MDNHRYVEPSTWIAEARPTGQSEPAILAGFCEREVARGLSLTRTSLSALRRRARPGFVHFWMERFDGEVV